jgi:hypothetical protein
VDTYCELELHERNVTLQSLRQHREVVALWYRGLAILRNPILGEWECPQELIETPNGIQMFGLVGQLLGLEVSSAKAALDLLLGSHYSAAFAAIRHMVEAAIQIQYVWLFPDETGRWYIPSPNSPDLPPTPPACNTMVGKIQRRLKKAGVRNESAKYFPAVYDCWLLMTKGTHPSGEGITQVQPSDNDERHIVGPVYREHLVRVGFSHGLFGIRALLPYLDLAGRVDDDWRDKFGKWNRQRMEWDQKNAAG